MTNPRKGGYDHVPVTWCESCRKETMPTWAAAQTRAKGLKRIRGSKAMGPYPCPQGQGFHLTSEPRKRRKIIEAKAHREKRRKAKRGR